MSRFSSSDELVTLPRMSAADAIALGTALEAAAAAAAAAADTSPARRLPEPIARKFRRVIAAREGISDVVRARLQPVGSDTPGATAADRTLDGVWSGTRDFCLGFTKLPRSDRTGPLIDSAQALLDTLFKDGLGFTGLRFRVQWVESKNRLDLIVEKSLDAHFARLGGEVFLEELTAAQAAYGKALGLTESVPDSDANVREALSTFQTALRHYIVGVTGHADPDVPGSEELAETLLAPLNSWKPSSTSAAPEPPDADDPAAPDAPAADDPAAAPEATAEPRSE